jgi:hypothetical protein
MNISANYLGTNFESASRVSHPGLEGHKYYNVREKSECAEPECLPVRIKQALE